MKFKNNIIILFIWILLIVWLSSCTNTDNNLNNSDSKIVNEKINQNLKRVWISEFKTELVKNDYTLIDLRTTPELKQTWIISWAIQIDFYAPNFKEKLSYLDKNSKYLIYCRSGNRSGSAIPIMKEMWFINVIELKSWMNTWLSSWEKTLEFE